MAHFWVNFLAPSTGSVIKNPASPRCPSNGLGIGWPATGVGSAAGAGTSTSARSGRAGLCVVGRTLRGVMISPSRTSSASRGPRGGGVTIVLGTGMMASRLIPCDSTVNTGLYGTGSPRSTSVSCISLVIPRRCISAVSACVPRTMPRTPASGSSGMVGLAAGSSAVGCGLTWGCSPEISSVLSTTLRPPSSTSMRRAPATPLA